jgi:hypothetical protein
MGEQDNMMNGHPTFVSNYKKVLDVTKEIVKEATEKKESYGVNIVGESLIISTFKKMHLPQLEQVRYILNKI